MYEKYFEYIKKFDKSRILVIGDLILDRFVYGNVNRISPEAPVPVVEVEKEIDLPGGAGNVANNIASLNGKVYLASVIGNDIVGEKLKTDLTKKEINTECIFTDETRFTTVKTRIIGQHQQIVRFDKESTHKLSQTMTEKIIDFIKSKINEIQTIIISDYGKGVINQLLLSKIINISKEKKIFVTVDPKVEHFLKYRYVSCITPNLKEAIQGMHLSYKTITEQDILNLGEKILKKLKCDSVIITRGENGMSVFVKNKKAVHIPTRAKEVYDVTGAGDTVIAVLSLCLAAGADILTSSEIANYAAGIVVGKLGTATVNIEELKSAIKNA